MIRTLSASSIFLLATLVIATRFTGRTTRADLTYVNPSGVHTLDPARMSWTQDFRLALNLWEGLTTWDARTLAPVPAAAAQPEISSDGLTYTFRIRGDARWSNGDVVTAADFIRGWRRAIEPGTAADYAFFLTDHIAGAREYFAWRTQHVAALPTMDQPAREAALAAHAAEMDARFQAVGLRASEDQILVVRLRRPCAYFLDLIASPVFLPCHESIERLRVRHNGVPLTPEGLVVFDPQWTKPKYRPQGYAGLVTNGPYRLAEWVFRQRVRLEANPFYREAAATQCRTVDMLEYPSVNAALMAYEAGDVDLLTDLTVAYDHELARLARTGQRPDFHACTVSATYFLNFNCAREQVRGRKNPFADARVRKAFTLATDRVALVEQVLARGDQVARSIVPPGAMSGYSPPPGLPFEPAAATDLLRQAGYQDGQAIGPIELLCTFNDERMAQALARMWRENLGVQVELRTQESKTLAQDKADRNFVIARGNWYADYADPTTFLNCHTTGDGNNDSGYSSAEYDEWIAEAARTIDGGRRLELLARAEAVLVEQDCPVLPILHYSQMIAIKPYVRGLQPNARLWFPFRYVAVER